jgi:hypothetical protein
MACVIFRVALTDAIRLRKSFKLGMREPAPADHIGKAT